MGSAAYIVREQEGVDPVVVGALVHGHQLVVMLVSGSRRPASIRDPDPLDDLTVDATLEDGTPIRRFATGVTGFGPRWVHVEFQGVPDPPPATISVTFGRPGDAASTELLTRCAAGS
jgi:hypothetical protein